MLRSCKVFLFLNKYDVFMRRIERGDELLQRCYAREVRNTKLCSRWTKVTSLQYQRMRLRMPDEPIVNLSLNVVLSLYRVVKKLFSVGIS